MKGLTKGTVYPLMEVFRGTATEYLPYGITVFPGTKHK